MHGEPFLRPATPFGASAKPTPDGWSTHPAGRWRDRDAEVVYDPRRHDVALVTGAAPGVAASLANAGWHWRGTDGAQEWWVRDRIAAVQRRLAHASTAALAPARGVAR